MRIITMELWLDGQKDPIPALEALETRVIPTILGLAGWRIERLDRRGDVNAFDPNGHQIWFRIEEVED